MEEEEGWFAWKYGSRTPRKAFRFRHENAMPATFLTMLVPYQGKEQPTVSASRYEKFKNGDAIVEIKTSAFGKTWKIGRDLGNRTAWCERQDQ
jgi:hypothetical protein